MQLPSLRWNEITDRLGLGALLIFAFSAWLGTGVAHAALLSMALLAAANHRQAWTSLRRDPLARVFLLFLGYLLIGAAWAARRWPETAQTQWSAVWPWASLWLFLPVAWWLRGSWNRIRAVMILAPLGLIAGISRRSQWSDFPRWLDGERYEFGYTSLGISLLSLVILIGLLSFLPRLISLGRTPMYRALAALGVAALLLLFLFVLLVAQSRGAWLSFGFAILLLGGLAAARRTAAPKRTPGLLPALWLAGVLAVAAIAQLGGQLAERVRSEAGVVPQLLTLDEAHLPYTPWGARIHLALWGMRLIERHPWFGYGPGANAPRHLLKLEFGPPQSGFLTVVEHFVHLHNAYLEILMRFGLLGGSLFAAGLFFFVRGMHASAARGRIPADVYRFGQVVLFTMLFFGFFEFRLLHTDFRFLTVLFCGIFYTHALHRGAHED